MAKAKSVGQIMAPYEQKRWASDLRVLDMYKRQIALVDESEARWKALDMVLPESMYDLRARAQACIDQIKARYPGVNFD